MNAAEIRAALLGLNRERTDHRTAGAELDRRSGAALLAARHCPTLTLEKACELLGLSKPTGYKLLAAAEKRA